MSPSTGTRPISASRPTLKRVPGIGIELSRSQASRASRSRTCRVTMATLFRPHSLSPDPVISAETLAQGKRSLVLDAAWASLVGALYGGVILTGFALELGASPVIIGLL